MKEHKSVSVMIKLPSIKKLLLRFKNIAPSIHQCRSNDYYKLVNESREYITRLWRFDFQTDLTQLLIKAS